MAGDSSQDLQAWVGRHVELELRYENGEAEPLSLDLVSDQAADFDHGLLGESTPLAQAILGKTAGSPVSYHAGDITQVRILAVTAALTAQPQDLSARREEVTRKAVDQSDKTSLIMYASSMNSKWGDYDPNHLQRDEDEK